MSRQVSTHLTAILIPVLLSAVHRGFGQEPGSDPAPSVFEMFRLGDVTRDGNVDLDDAHRIAEFVINGVPLEVEPLISDTNNDRIVNLEDAVLVAQYANGAPVPCLDATYVVTSIHNNTGEPIEWLLQPDVVLITDSRLSVLDLFDEVVTIRRGPSFKNWLDGKGNDVSLTAGFAGFDGDASSLEGVRITNLPNEATLRFRGMTK